MRTSEVQARERRGIRLLYDTGRSSREGGNLGLCDGRKSRAQGDNKQVRRVLD